MLRFGWALEKRLGRGVYLADLHALPAGLLREGELGRERRALFPQLLFSLVTSITYDVSSAPRLGGVL
jgi:hypothetical protein